MGEAVWSRRDLHHLPHGLPALRNHVTRPKEARKQNLRVVQAQTPSGAPLPTPRYTDRLQVSSEDRALPGLQPGSVVLGADAPSHGQKTVRGWKERG